ncbi:hypothetical protein [Mycobacterium colombiense]|nr:hypothetical protein [Mycobacterium colombiense]
MSFVTTNRWSQVSSDRQTTADLRFIDASTVARTPSATPAASVRLTATV